MASEQTFDDYCLSEIGRFSAFGEFSRFTRAEGIVEMASWLVVVAAGDKKKAHRIVSETISECIEQETTPDLRRLARIKNSLFPRPKPRAASLDCAYCHGEGYETFEGPDKTTFASRCRCGGTPRSEPLTHEELVAPKDEELAALIREAAAGKSL